MTLTVAGVRKKCVRTCEQAAVERRDACQAFRWIARPKECISDTAIVPQIITMPPSVSQERARATQLERMGPQAAGLVFCGKGCFYPPIWKNADF